MRTCDVCEAEKWTATQREYFESAGPAAESVTVDICDSCLPKIDGYADALKVAAGSFVDDEGDAERDER